MPHTTPPEPSSASGTTLDAAPRTIACSSTRAGLPAATGRIRGLGGPSAPIELPPGAHTTLRHAQFAHELAHHPHKAWVSSLLNGLRYGVRLGYKGARHPIHARNLLSSQRHPEAIDRELARECGAGRVLGPFPFPPLHNLCCSGLGAVPKKDGRWRMILHLSAPAGHSVNDHIAREEFSLQYASVDDAVRMLLALGPGARMAKVDLKSAFRMVPVHPTDWHLLGMRWRDNYFIDTCLPFGLRSAPFLFNEFAAAIEWIMCTNYSITHLLHYLDDYLMVGPPGAPDCGQHLANFLRVAVLLGVQVAMEKVDGPATTLGFLGLLLDSVRQEIRLSPTKLAELLKELSQWAARKSTTKRDILSLIGKLSFAARAVPAGRLFLRRLIFLSTTVSRLHHHIRLDRDARAGIDWWRTFLPSWNGTAKFIHPSATSAVDIELYTDASGVLGCGAYFQGSWFHLAWQPHQQPDSIQWKELFAIVAAAYTWGHAWSGRRIRFYCDNEAIVLSWEHRRCKQPHIMALLRTLFLTAAANNYHVLIKHLPGCTNELADALSRKQFHRFFSLAPQADKTPTATPGILTTL